MTTRRERAAGHWDRHAADYDRRTAGLEARFLGPSREWVCRRADGATLEVGVGTGANLAYYPPSVSLTAVDASPLMLDQARDKAARLGLDVTLTCADAQDLPFPDASFDTVVSTFTMCCVADECGALDEAIRVLRPGGRLLLADHVGASAWPVRVLQHLANLLTVPLQGEHWTRRPARVLEGLGVDIVERQRLSLGLIERVHARPAVSDE